MKILVTGAGFIGMNASTSLSARGHNVIGIDNFNDYYNPKVKDEDKLNSSFWVSDLQM